MRDPSESRAHPITHQSLPTRILMKIWRATGTNHIRGVLCASYVTGVATWSLNEPGSSASLCQTSIVGNKAICNFFPRSLGKIMKGKIMKQKQGCFHQAIKGVLRNSRGTAYRASIPQVEASQPQTRHKVRGKRSVFLMQTDGSEAQE